MQLHIKINIEPPLVTILFKGQFNSRRRSTEQSERWWWTGENLIKKYFLFNIIADESYERLHLIKSQNLIEKSDVECEILLFGKALENLKKKRFVKLFLRMGMYFMVLDNDVYMVCRRKKIVKFRWKIMFYLINPAKMWYLQCDKKYLHQFFSDQKQIIRQNKFIASLASCKSPQCISNRQNISMYSHQFHFFSRRLCSSNIINKRKKIFLSLVYRSASLDCFRKSAALRTSAPYDIINLLFWIFIVLRHCGGCFCWWLFLTTCYQLFFFFVKNIFFSFHFFGERIHFKD